MAVLTAASGGMTSAAMRQGATVLFSQLLIAAMDRLLKEGGVLFRVPVDDRASMEGTLLRQLARRYTYEQSAALRGLNCRMEAVFYGEDGRELGRAELATPEDGEHAVS